MTAVFPKLTPTAVFPLGAGWAANTVNTAIYRGHGLTTRGQFQYGSFYRSPEEIVIFSRDVRGDAGIVTHEMALNADVLDAHNVSSMGCDANGYVHICYSSHGTALNYRRSEKPWRIDAWSEPMSMTGVFENKVTYPYFLFSDAAEKPHIFIYRHGSSNNGEIRIKKYDVADDRWIDMPTPVLSGMNQAPWTAGPYINHPAVSPNGDMHWFFTWRGPLVGKGGFVNNHNIDYARSKDWLIDWRSSKGLQFALPITPVNSETILGTTPGSSLMNQCSAATDSTGRPFVAFYMNGRKGTPQYHVAWPSRNTWQVRQVFAQEKNFKLAGRGTLKLPISRPELLIGADDRAWVIFRADSLGGCMAAVALDPPGHHYLPENVYILWDEDLGSSEPIIDRERFARDGVLSMLIQATDQGDHEGLGETTTSNVNLVEWILPSRKPASV